MTLLKIARMGHPVLRQVAQAVVRPDAAEIRRIADDMVETLLDAPGIGLAAPQVHLPLRMIVFRAADAAGDYTRIVRLVNPEIVVLDDTIEHGWEGCLSIPELRGIVPRVRRLRWSGTSPEGLAIAEEAEGYTARVLQHEVDHLDGVLYLDRMTNLQQLTYPEHLARFQETAL